MEENADVKLALEEMRLNMDQSLSAGDAIDQKVNLILVASGLILGMVYTLQISLDPNRSNLYWGLLLVAFGLYIAVVALSLWLASPQPYRMAIASDWNELETQLFGKLERDAIRVLLSGYVEQIQHNRKINRTKAAAFRLSVLCLLATVIVMTVLVIIP
jgi:hypothetical protein